MGFTKPELPLCRTSINAYDEFSRPEVERFYAMWTKFLSDNKGKTLTQWQEMIAENAIVLHIRLQRIRDMRQFWSTEPTDIVKNSAQHSFSFSDSPHATADDKMQRKVREFDDLYLKLSKELREWIALAVSEKVSINISGSMPSVQKLFEAHDKMRGKVDDSSSDKTNTPE